jgi:hypothetical protein
MGKTKRVFNALINKLHPHNVEGAGNQTLTFLLSEEVTLFNTHQIWLTSNIFQVMALEYLSRIIGFTLYLLFRLSYEYYKSFISS